MHCPCDTQRLYKNCCAIAHHQINDVATAQQLMRSRYSAFVIGDIDFLQRSHHSSMRPSKKEAREIKQWTQSVDWIKLEVLQTNKGLKNDLTGTVEFKAYFMENGRVDVIHEHSRFCKENGHWVYLDAMV
ncbi:Sec-C motif domain protein [Nonlabens arenilitoris]|uniref:Sec-C motif domain protein n=1 Tax=Nonlabens arenilitoris TaxID=1217969 RepID=A0A2S7UCM7_9FLAO|nr:Sec-C motif domain protein [Nonlabens arenilitoris]